MVFGIVMSDTIHITYKHKTRVSQSQAKRNYGDSANMDTQLRHSVTKGCHSITNYVYENFF